MTDTAVARPSNRYGSPAFARRLRRRHAAGRMLELSGIAAIAIALTMLAVLLGSIVARGYSAFWQTDIRLEVFYDPAVIAPDGARTEEALSDANYRAIVRDALERRLGQPGSREAERQMYDLISANVPFQLRRNVIENPDLVGQRETLWLPTSDDLDLIVKGVVPRDVPASERQLSDQQLAWLDELKAAGHIDTRFNIDFFTSTDSREPEAAGIWGATVGSMMTLVVTLLVALPIAVAAAVYLEEFAVKNRWTELIEVNISNLAAVPSIIYGLLGLAVFLNFLGLPRSSPLAGGLVLALMTLPIIIISTRSALRAVPPSIREAARMVGASPHQVVLFHVLPVALPGLLTGTIIGMAQALGETAPLLLMGMVAFVSTVPDGLTDSATVLPVQIYLWAESAERAFVAKTSAAIMVLLVFLMLMNGLAIYLRRRFEKRW